MKKLTSLLLVLAMCIAVLTACGAKKETTPAASSAAASASSAETSADAMAHAEYTVYNTTGAAVTELYLYNAGSEDKGENLAGEGLADGDSIVITRDATEAEAAETTYVLEFTAEGMDAQKFETLHFEEAPISLLSVDAASGATPIAFSAPQ